MVVWIYEWRTKALCNKTIKENMLGEKNSSRQFMMLLVSIIVSITLYSNYVYGKIWNCTRITYNNDYESVPSFDNNQVAFLSGEWEGEMVCFMDLNNGIKNEIFDPENNKYSVYNYLGSPTLSNGKIVWRGYKEISNTDTIFLWDGTETIIITEHECGPFDYDGYPPSYGSIEPYIHNGQIAYAAWDGSDYEIFFWNGTEIIQITDNELDDYEPQVFNGTISFTHHREEAPERFGVYYWDGSEILDISQLGTQQRGAEDSNIGDEKIVYCQWVDEEYKFDIYLWDGRDKIRFSPVVGFDFEPEINEEGTLITWSGYPYGKPGQAVGWVWDGYKLFNIMETAPFVSIPKVDGNNILFRAQGDFNKWELFIAKYITGSYKCVSNIGYARNTLTDGNIVYVANGYDDLRIVNCTDPSNPLEEGSLFIDDSCPAFDIEKKGNFIFLANRCNGIAVINVADPAKPSLVSSFETSDLATHITIKDNLLYVGDRYGGLKIININNPENLFETGSLEMGHTCGIEIKDHIAYVANYNDGLRVIDIRNPENLISLGRYDPENTTVWDIGLWENYAFLICKGHGIKIIDISDPANPEYVGECIIPDGKIEGHWAPPFDIDFIGKNAFVGNGSEGVLVIDFSDPSVPRIVERIDTPGYSWGVNIEGEKLYVSDGDEGFHIIEVSDYRSPQDFDYDGDVDGNDLIKLSVTYDSKDGHPEYNEKCDLDDDSDVDEQDLEIFTVKFGMNNL